MTKSPCDNCGSVTYRTWRTWFEGKPHSRIQLECCSDCKNIRPTYYRDASGSRIKYDEALTGKFSYATGEVMRSQKHLAEYCKKNNLNQKGE